MIEYDFLDKTDDLLGLGIWNIKVFGLGVTAGNALEALKERNLPNVECRAFPTSSEESYFASAECKSWLDGTDILVIAVGINDGISFLSKVAEIAQELNITSIGLVRVPCGEQTNRIKECIARYPGLACLNALIPVQAGQCTLSACKEAISEASSESKLWHVVCDLVSILTLEDCDNLDYADIVSLLRFKGNSAYGMGLSRGDSALENALEIALEDLRVPHNQTIECLGLLFFVRAGQDLAYSQLEYVVSKLYRRISANTCLLVGISFDRTMLSQASCALLATGMHSN